MISISFKAESLFCPVWLSHLGDLRKWGVVVVDLGERGGRGNWEEWIEGELYSECTVQDKKKNYFQFLKKQQKKVETPVNRQKERPQELMEGHSKKKEKDNHTDSAVETEGSKLHLSRESWPSRHGHRETEESLSRENYFCEKNSVCVSLSVCFQNILRS